MTKGGFKLKAIESVRGWKAFAAGFAGEAVLPQSADYDAARAIWNGAIDRRPLAILRVATVDDVVAAVRFAREAELPTAVRSGGHSYPGHSTCDDGLVIDLSQLSSVEFEPERHLVRVGAGVLLGAVDRATAAHGQVLPAGIVSHTGLAGLALGGGIGYLTRSFGLTCDQFVRLQVVTADGELVYASEDEHPDLLWALRGGGGNFGIVTQFECRTHTMGTFQAGHLFYPMSSAVSVMTKLADLVVNGPRTLTIAVGLGISPEDVGIDSPNGEPLMDASLVYRGELDDEPLREVRSVHKPLLDTIGQVAFTDWQSQYDIRSGPGFGWYMKSRHSTTLSPELVGKMVENAIEYRKYAAPNMFEKGVFSFMPIGGAANDIADADSAYSGRAAQWHTAVEVAFTTPADRDRLVNWAREAWAETEPLHDLNTSYVNMLVDERTGSVEDVYGAEKLERLSVVKARYDPTNFFRLNSNVVPAPSVPAA